MDVVGPGLAGLIITLVSWGVPLLLLWVLLRGGLVNLQEHNRKQRERRERGEK